MSQFAEMDSLQVDKYVTMEIVWMEMAAVISVKYSPVLLALASLVFAQSR